MAYRYPTFKFAGKTKQRHRHAAESKIGRPVRADEHVHHIDGDPWNWSADNLEVLPAEDHLRLHADARLIHPREKVCEICGALYAPHRMKRKRSKTCSPPCANTLRTKNSWATRKAAIVGANCQHIAVEEERRMA